MLGNLCSRQDLPIERGVPIEIEDRLTEFCRAVIQFGDGAAFSFFPADVLPVPTITGVAEDVYKETGESTLPIVLERVVMIAIKNTSGEIIVSLEVDSLKGHKFEGLDLSGADMSEMDLSEAVFRNCKLARANCRGANFSKAKIENSVANGIDFTSADLQDADLSDIVMKGANLDFVNAKGTQFRHAKLSNCSFKRAILIRADFNFAELQADLSDSDLTGANLISADLTDGDLRRANLERANMTSANVSNTNFKDARMVGSISPNGRVWGVDGPFKHRQKKPWWRMWGNAAL